jgi:hypothetical protein
MDPRVKVSEAGLEKKFHSEMRLASLLSETSKAVMRAGSVNEPLQKLTQQATGTTLDSIKAFEKKLAEVAGAQDGFFAPPSEAVTLARVNGQLSVLYGQVWQVDAEPTPTQSDAIAATEHDASEAMKRWEALKSSDLPALNQALKAANLPEVKIDSDPHKAEAFSDEE